MALKIFTRDKEEERGEGQTISEYQNINEGSPQEIFNQLTAVNFKSG